MSLVQVFDKILEKLTCKILYETFLSMNPVIYCTSFSLE